MYNRLLSNHTKITCIKVYTYRATLVQIYLQLQSKEGERQTLSSTAILP